MSRPLHLRRGRRASDLAAACALLAAASVGPVAAAEGGATAVDWPYYAGDPGSRKYSPLDQVDADNARELMLAWAWSAPDNERRGELGQEHPGWRIDHFKGTPILVGGRLFARTSLGIVAAIDPASGESFWVYDSGRYRAGYPPSYGFTTRGVAFWQDEEGAGARILFTTSDRKLIALDAATGAPVPSFGEGGVVHLDRSQRRQGENPWLVNYGNQVPVVVGDVAVVGSVVSESPIPYLRRGEPHAEPVVPTGDIRGFDVRTGALRWTFHTTPQEGETGVESWGDGSWRWMGSTNVWSLMSADPELGAVFAPVSAPTYNYYGGVRPGANLFGQAVVCLDAATGALRWHYQTVHHPLWDYDLPAAPVLADLRVEGRNVPALIQVSKTGFAYVLDRRTGAPIWPIEERAVPPSTVPGERPSPTQPFPTRPPAFAQQGLDDSSLLSLTPELRALALEVVRPHRRGPIFTPVSLEGTVLSPGISGGANWPGGALDPDTRTFFVTAMNLPYIRGLEPADMFFRYRTTRFGNTVEGLPLVNPPWGTITAIDLDHGALRWQVANGEGPRRHPRLRQLDLPYLGVPAKSNPLATKTLLFAATSGQGIYGTGPDLSAVRASARVPAETLAALDLGSRAVLRAYDKATGAVVAEHPIGPSYNDGGAPMTYSCGGRQYLVLPTGGGRDDAWLVAFALPTSDDPGRLVAAALSTVSVGSAGSGPSAAPGLLGRRLFDADCSACHGEALGSVPLRGAADLTAESLRSALASPPSGMPVFAYDDAEIRSLLSYLQAGP